MLGRPIPVWIILAFLAYTLVGTVLNLGGAVGGEQNFDVGVMILGVVSAVVSAWLIVEIWSDRARQVTLAWALVGVTALIYVYAFILFEPAAGGDMLSRSKYIAVAVMGLVMVGLHLLIPWYQARRKTA